jgi:hypothetical protein
VERVEAIADTDAVLRLAISREGLFERRYFGAADVIARSHRACDGGVNLGLELEIGCLEVEELDRHDAGELPVAATKVE